MESGFINFGDVVVYIETEGNLTDTHVIAISNGTKYTLTPDYSEV